MCRWLFSYWQIGRFIDAIKSWPEEDLLLKSHRMNCCYSRVLRWINTTEVIEREDCFPNRKEEDDRFPNKKEEDCFPTEKWGNLLWLLRSGPRKYCYWNVAIWIVATDKWWNELLLMKRREKDCCLNSKTKTDCFPNEKWEKLLPVLTSGQGNCFYWIVVI